MKGFLRVSAVPRDPGSLCVSSMSHKTSILKGTSWDNMAAGAPTVTFLL